MNQNNGFGIVAILLLSIFFTFAGASVEIQYLGIYFICCLSIVIVSLLIYGYAIKNKFDIFDPLYFISAIYCFMYFVTPIYDIFVGETTWFGYSLFQYGIKATTYALIGYLFFYFFYSKVQVGNRYVTHETIFYNDVPTDKLIPTIILMYVVCFVANAYYMIRYYGMNLQYLLSFGLLGSHGTSTNSGSIGFISMLSYSFSTTVLLYWEYGNSRALKIILFIPMIMMQITRGFRFFLIQIAVTFFGFIYIRKGKRPKISAIIVALTSVIAIVIIMTMFRESVRWGLGINSSGINWESIGNSFDEAFWDNFRVYQNYYGMVGVIPSRYSYVWGRQIILGTIVMMIPRIIWPGKISSYGGVGLKTLIGQSIASGQAYPTLGEYYYAFGVIGICFFMSIYGLWAKKIRNWKRIEAGALKNIEFCVLLGINLQLIIRGYFPSNFWYIIFSLLPIWIVRKLGLTYRIIQEKE